jgi:hypothetical protein
MSEEKLDATFFAFKKRDQRFVLTRAAAAYLALYLVGCAIYAVLAWSAIAPAYGWYFNAIMTASEGGEPPAPPADLMRLAPLGLGSVIAFMALFAAFEAACLRWLVRGESGGGLFGLKAGADTWRIFAIYWLWILVSLVIIIAVVLLYVGLQAIGSIGGAAQLAAMLVGGLVPLAVLALWIFIAVRLAPAAAESIAQQRLVFFGAWRVTRGHFWPLLGSFVIIIVGYLVVALIAGQIIQIPIEREMAPIVHEMMTSRDASEAARRMAAVMQTPTFLIFGSLYLIVTAAIACVYYVAMFGVNARAAQAARVVAPPVAGEA